MIENDGWILHRQKGSHKIYIHPSKKGIVVIPDHGLGSEVKKGTENSILKQAIELNLESITEDGEKIPLSKGLCYHIEQGIFNEKQIGEEYYIAQVEIHLPKAAV